VAQKFSKETYLYWYELMQLIRQFESKSEEMYKMAGKIRGFFHVYNGQEAIAAGCMTATNHEDPFITGYRDHGLALAKGMSPNAAMAELYGKATGCSKGKGGSMHLFDKANYFFGGHGIVGAQIGTGAGLAFAEQYRGSKNVVLCFFGDGAARQGMLHEVFNLAMLWKLPVVFICENNGYAMGTSVERTANHTDIWKLGLGYEMPCGPVDGMNPVKVAEAMHEAMERARRGDGPTFLEMKTYRYRGHSMSDAQLYRSKDEVEEYKKIDPITQVLDIIKESNYATDAEIEIIDERVKDLVEECATFAEESDFPEAQQLYDVVYEQENYPFIPHRL
jgi:pyruvate dehydrogenase E1 component alpha subunit